MWPDEVDEILDSDQTMAFAYVTPASGVVLAPLTNTAMRDRQTGQLEPVSTSVAMWKKLERIRANPRVAIAYHTRLHAHTDRPEYVLLQGDATHTPIEDRGWAKRNEEAFERFAGRHRPWPWIEPLLRAYLWRVGIRVDATRFVVWPDLACRGEAAVHGAPLPAAPPEPQADPKKGTGPRVDHEKAAKRMRKLPHVLLGWVGADGYPVVVPVSVAGTVAEGILVDLPPGVEAPPGGRRAGMLAHTFARYTFGQNQRTHSGWMVAQSSQRVLYAPHTAGGYVLPESEVLFRLVSGFETHRRLRQAQRAGFVPKGYS